MKKRIKVAFMALMAVSLMTGCVSLEKMKQ